MKLVVNIPCLNEEKTLPQVLKELPRSIPGIDVIEVQVVDDGSKDRTSEIARKAGCIVISHKTNLGLGVAFKHGAQAALDRKADIFVNTDADNQYPSKYIPELIRPVLEGRADMVIGNRTPWKIKHFSLVKRLFQFIGNRLASYVAGTRVPDAVSGFRAYSSESLMQLNVSSKFSYVLDTIVQASKKGLVIESIPITTNLPTRKSRLFKNIFQHMRKSAMNITRCYALYEPFKTFLLISMIFYLPAFFLFARFMYYYLGGSSGHIQSLIVAAILFFMGALSFSMGVLGELIASNRRLIEEQLYLQKKQAYVDTTSQ